VVSLFGHMWPSNPPYEVGYRSIEVEESGRGCSDAILVYFGLSVPIGIEPSCGGEWNIPIVTQKIAKQSGWIVGHTQGLPRVLVADKETRLPQW